MVAGNASTDYLICHTRKEMLSQLVPPFGLTPLSNLSATYYIAHLDNSHIISQGGKEEYVDFVEGLSQGCPSGSSLTVSALHL
jgi:hypothetical protein